MASDNVAKLDALENNKTISGIAGLSKIDGRVYDKQARQDEKMSKFHEKIFQDQVLAHIRLLQYHHQSSYEDKKMTCPLQKSALVALYEFYSFKLRPVDISKTSLETLLQRQLLEIIDQPYVIHDDSCNPATVSTIEGPDSPLWDLHEWSLKLTRLLINNGHLSADTADIVENHLVKLLETIQKCQLRGQACPRTSNNIAIIAHCLCRILKINKPLGSAQRRLLSSSFICDHLFSLACEFAARECPASILDPISYYQVFESSGELVDSDMALVEWNRRNERKEAPGNSRYSSTRDRPGTNLENDYGDSGDEKADPLPPAHVCLLHLIFKVTVLSNRADRDIVAKFLQRKVLKLKNKPNGDNPDGPMADANDKVGKFALMNKIVALHVLGPLKLQPNPSFLNVLVLPHLQEDSLLLKICKFQLARFLTTDDIEQRIKFTQAFLGEFKKIMRIEDYQDEHNKLFVIFASVASECLYDIGSPDRLKVHFDTIFTLPDRKTRVNLIKKIIALYLDYRIVALLVLIDIMQHEDKSEDFQKECEHLMTKVIGLIAAELLILPPDSDRAQNLSLQLFTATFSRGQPLTDTIVHRLIRLAETRIFDVNASSYRCYDPMNWETHTLSYLKCALTFPLDEQTKLFVIDILDRFFKEIFSDDGIILRKILYLTLILGNLCYYQMTSWSLLNKSSTSSGDIHQQFEKRHLLFESPERIRYILDSANEFEERTDFTSAWIMFTLMSWPSIQEAVGPDLIRTLVIVDPIWYFFVELAVNRLNEIETNKGGRSIRGLFHLSHDVDLGELHEYKTRYNLSVALIAAFNHDPKRLEDHLNRVIGPVAQSSSGRSHTLKYVKIWLDVVIGTFDGFMRPVEKDMTFVCRSIVVISCQALINIHRAQTDGKLGFSIKNLTSKLDSVRQIVLEWLADYRQQAIRHESPLESFYAHSTRQLEAIGSFL